MKAIIVDNDWVYLENPSTSAEEVIKNRLSAKHKAARYINDVEQQSWDGYYYKYYDKLQKFARPLLPAVMEVCRKYKIPIAVEDLRPDYNGLTSKTGSVLTDDILPGITLEYYQREAIEAILQTELGIIKVPTGGGKTEIMAAVAKLYGRATVIISDIRVVIEQIKERMDLRDVIGGNQEVGLFYGGATPSGQKVIVGSIQSLTTPPISLKKKNKQMYAARMRHARQFQKIVKASGLLMVDECDKAVSKPYRALFRFFFKGRHKYGFSATPFDPDKPVENLILEEHMGPVIYEVPRGAVQATGRIIPIVFYAIVIEPDDPKIRPDSRAFDIAEREDMIEGEQLHEAVLKICRAFPDEGTLILVDTSNIEDLGKALEDKIPNSKFIYGKTTKTQRRKYIKAFEDRELKVLIGGKILKRGLDLKGGAENLIMIGGGKLFSNFDQKIGRAVRVNKRGWARVFNFFIRTNKYLYEHSRKQLKALVEMGYESKVVFKHATVDGAKFVKSRFRRPK